ncbi:MAG TPA: type III-B CRISPR module RAMP protein Cmr6 [Methylocella sp.]|nr:type III-B CRISPR module RAMP protein Cmr6 [Methylocella sp.]
MRQEIVKLAESRRRGNHPGLILQRYLISQSDPEERRKLLDATREAARSDLLRAVYAEAYRRWERSFAGDRPFRSERLTTAGRLIVGLGSENVLETGLRLHHTYGVPIIPGSALKGLASHYCDDVWGQRHLGDNAPQENKRFRRKRSADKVEGDYHRLLFGTTEDGSVITFHDAWIVPESVDDGALRLDVMTPHHPQWQSENAPAPTDFDSPNPVSFLSVAGTFDVRLSWSGLADTPPEKAEAWTGLAMEILREALAEWGAGGKTSSGYGQLVPGSRDESATPSSAAGPGAGKPAESALGRIARPKPGEKVEARLLEERTKKGQWKAKHPPSGFIGNIENSDAVPADKKPGDTLQLIVASATAFKFPTPEEEARARRVTGKGQGGRGRDRRR